MGSAAILATDRDVKLVKATVARDLEPAELDLFIHMCRQWRLDPLRRQIYAQVYKRKKKDDDGNWTTARNVVYVTGIDGYRTIADRTGNYRPGQRSVDQRDDAKNPATNPQGIISATASVWKHVHGEWHEFSETVYWDEFAPIKEEWAENDRGKRVKTGKSALDTSGQWGKMGRVMLQKCAEAQALRRGWPDEYGDLYVAEEMDQARVIDITPSEQAERADADAKLALAGGKDALTIDWNDGKPLARVPLGRFADAIMEYARRDDVSAMEVRAMWHRNLPARTEFKARHGSDYLDLQRWVERETDAKEQRETQQAAE